MTSEPQDPDGFSPLERAAWGGLLTTYTRLDRLVERDLLDRFGISHPEFEVLLRLSFAERGRMRIQDLAADSVLTASGISRVVERLQRAGHVTRESAPEDRRGAYAVITDQGLETFRAAAAAHVALVRAEFLDRFEASELEAMAALWRHLEEGDAGRQRTGS
jgi:DNA-binding MarR family transcriptional regulator